MPERVRVAIALLGLGLPAPIAAALYGMPRS